MKQKYRKRALHDLLARMDDRNYDNREHALFQLALVLDRSNQRIEAAKLPEYYAENLSRDLLRLRLSQAEQAAVAARLARLVESKRQSRSTAVWTLAKLNAEIGLPVLLDLVRSIGEKLDNETAIQVCAAMRNWLKLDAEHIDSLLDHDASILFLRVLRQWRERGNGHLKADSTTVSDLLKARHDESPGTTDQ